MKQIFQNISSNQKGSIGQKYFELLMTQNHIPCFKPINEFLYDYVILINNKFVRIEVKTSATDKDGALVFCTNHSDGRNCVVPYTIENVDFIFVYSLSGHYALLPPKVWEGKRNISLRYKNANNGAIYPMFQDYEFNKTINNIFKKEI